MSTAKQAIGIFDSGIGGLTVAKAVRALLPGEPIIYVGDTARVPYGIKSEETVQRYAAEITKFLRRQDVKMIIIACNTVSAAALSVVQEQAGSVPVLDVISSGAEAALAHNDPAAHIGIIGTLATVHSKAYQRALLNLRQDISITAEACPLLVPLAEEGWIDHPVTRQTLRIYLESFRNKSIDRLILGCTHYPLFKSVIREVGGFQEDQLIDSAEVIARHARRLLTERNLLHPSDQPGDFTCYVSDRPQRFMELAERFLGDSVEADVIREWE
jgi:glutamate racemase